MNKPACRRMKLSHTTLGLKLAGGNRVSLSKDVRLNTPIAAPTRQLNNMTLYSVSLGSPGVVTPASTAAIRTSALMGLSQSTGAREAS